MTVKQRYDFLIIGGGTAGCIIARRLADRLPDASIALLEAGKSDLLDTATNYLSRLDEQDQSYDWGYQARPNQNASQEIEYARARVLGGCANHNDCAFIPPNRSDLERWQSLAGDNWSPETLEPALKRIEDSLYIDSSPEGNALSRAFINANMELGLRRRNVRLSDEPGTGWFPLNTNGDLRQSSSVAYLHSLKRLPRNLEIITEINVSRLLINNRTVVGAETDRGEFFSNRETILCAGSIGSPLLLLHSGIGPAEHLRHFEIPVIHNATGVGQNLIDHVAANISCELRDKPPDWSLTPCEATALIKVDPLAPAPDVLFHFVLRLREKYLGQQQFNSIPFGVKLSPNVARPRSRGSIRLVSNNPSEAPEIDLNYFSDADNYDQRTLIAGLRYARRLCKTDALSFYLKNEIAPGTDIESDGDFIEYIQQTCETVYHPCGTCAMGDGSSSNAVVDDHLKVIGIDRLRIVDASIFPDIVTANICNTVMMVAEHAVELMMKDYRL